MLYVCVYVLSVTVVDMSPGSMRNLMLYVCVVCMYVSVCVCVCGYMKADSEPVCRRCGHVSRLDVERDVKHTHTLSLTDMYSLSAFTRPRTSAFTRPRTYIYAFKRKTNTRTYRQIACCLPSAHLAMHTHIHTHTYKNTHFALGWRLMYSTTRRKVFILLCTHIYMHIHTYTHIKIPTLHWDGAESMCVCVCVCVCIAR